MEYSLDFPIQVETEVSSDPGRQLADRRSVQERGRWRSPRREPDPGFIKVADGTGALLRVEWRRFYASWKEGGICASPMPLVFVTPLIIG